MDRSLSESPSSPAGSPHPTNSTPSKLKYPFPDTSQGHHNGDSILNTSGTSSLSGGTGNTLGRKESYKMQRKNYRFEKKRAAKELLSTFKDPTVIVLSDWLKVRGTLKSWTKLWCVLKPGLLLLYKSDKHKDWVGTILLSMCKLIERPSKKDGFCFKLFHPLDQSIWAPKGPQGETIPAPIQPLPTSHLIFRVSSQGAGKCWMDALELALKCSSLLMRSMSTRSTNLVGTEQVGPTGSATSTPTASATTPTAHTAGDISWNESDFEKQYKDHDFDDTSHTDENDVMEMERRSGSAADPMEFNNRHSAHSRTHGTGKSRHSESESEEEEEEEILPLEDQSPAETKFIEQLEEEFGTAGDQTEELADDNKSLIWFLVKQVRPGMDLSKVVLPTFILEPRSFLDKLSDYYYHADILSRAVLEDDPFTRIKTVVQWYLSGFYKKPKGLKKPYNPILGELFRCCWRHPNGSTTFYIAEQVSHHPPVSALYVTNRQDGFTLSASILAKSKFYGNSLSALLEGSACLTLLPRGEDYLITMPYAHCKGILLGTLTMELGGEVYLKCEKTGYRADLEFKLKPMLGGADSMNYVTGKLRLGKETLATIWGYWDDCIHIEDKRTGERQVLWNPTAEVRAQRLKRCTVAVEQQLDCESEKLWAKVSAAIRQENQELATAEKTHLEEAQRMSTRERVARNETWIPRCFELDPVTESWQYRHADVRPWDLRNDLVQYESNFVIATRTRHRTPMIRAASIVSVERNQNSSDSLRHMTTLVGSSVTDSGHRNRSRTSRDLQNGAPTTSGTATGGSGCVPELRQSQIRRRNGDGSVSSSAEGDHLHSSEEDSRRMADAVRSRTCTVNWVNVLEHLEESHRETQEKLLKIHNSVQSMILQQQNQLHDQLKGRRSASRDLYLVALIMGLCQVLFWLCYSTK